MLGTPKRRVTHSAGGWGGQVVGHSTLGYRFLGQVSPLQQKHSLDYEADAPESIRSGHTAYDKI